MSLRADINVSEFMNTRNGQSKHLDGNGFRFYLHYTENKAETEKAGRLICDDVDFIEITNFAGERTPRKVEDRDKFAYPEHWAHYLATRVPPTSGTPLLEWCHMTPAKLAELGYFKLRTVDQVAAISDEMLKQFPGLEEWKRKATNWLAAADSKQNEVTKLKEQLVKSEKLFKKLEEQYHFAMKRIEAEQGGSFAQ